MKRFLSKVTVSRPFEQDQTCGFLNRYGVFGSEAPVRFLLHFCR